MTSRADEQIIGNARPLRVVAMLGFAEIREHLEPVDAPSVLNLFADSMAEKPTGMSSWDHALLKSMYRIDAAPLSQASEIG